LGGYTIGFTDSRYQYQPWGGLFFLVTSQNVQTGLNFLLSVILFETVFKLERTFKPTKCHE